MLRETLGIVKSQKSQVSSHELKLPFGYISKQIPNKWRKRMAAIRNFEEIQSWQKARYLTKNLYKTTSTGDFAKDFGLRDQIRRASVSIMANIAEGFGRHSDKEFANFLNIAQASASEVQSHLYVALDLEYINQEKFDIFYKLLDEISRMIYAFAQHLRKS